MVKNLENSINNDIIYEYKNGKIISNNILPIDGESPKNGTIIIKKDGKIGIAIEDGKWCAIKDYNDKDIQIDNLNEIECSIGKTDGFDFSKGVNKPIFGLQLL